jgi:2-iminobutanoate/2-iminopropanoate deaminase
MVYCSGQIPLDPETGLLVDGDLEAQTTRVLDNLDAVLRESDSSLDQTVKLTVFLTDLRNFDILNRVMARRFSSEPPARSVVQVAALPKGAALEMDLIALRNSAGKG